MRDTTSAVGSCELCQYHSFYISIWERKENHVYFGIYTTHQEKCNTGSRGLLDPNFGSATPWAQKVVNRGSFPDFESYFKSLRLDLWL